MAYDVESTLRYLSAGTLKRLLADVPDGLTVWMDQIGNLELVEEGDDERYRFVGWIDFADEELKMFEQPTEWLGGPDA